MAYILPIDHYRNGGSFPLPFQDFDRYTDDALRIEVVLRLDKTANPGGCIVASSDVETTTNYERGDKNVLFSLEIDRTAARNLVYRHESGNGVNTTATSSLRVPLGKWVRIVMVRSRSGSGYPQIMFYMDGVADGPYVLNTSPSLTGPSYSNSTQYVRLGQVYVDRYYNSIEGTEFSLAFLLMKRTPVGGKDTFFIGEDPGGAPGVIPPVLGATICDLLEGVSTRNPQIRTGAVDFFDSLAGVVVRPAQRVNGVLYDMTGAGGSGDGPGEISTPRNFPLEVQWKKANKATFEK